MADTAPNTSQTRIDQALQVNNAVMSWFAMITQRPIPVGPSYVEQTVGTTPALGIVLVVGIGLVLLLRK